MPAPPPMNTFSRPPGLMAKSPNGPLKRTRSPGSSVYR